MARSDRMLTGADARKSVTVSKHLPSLFGFHAAASGRHCYEVSGCVGDTRLVFRVGWCVYRWSTEVSRILTNVLSKARITPVILTMMRTAYDA